MGACKSLATCGNKPDADCQDRCTSGFGTTSCEKARPADQLTCSELEPLFDCIDYCGTLCERAPSCGSFNAQQCGTGCIMAGPDICNPASVAARTCDDLKPELREYQDLAIAASMKSASGDGKQPTKTDDNTFTGGSGKQTGLCRNSGECDESKACDTETSTCGPCKADADCVRPASSEHYVCDATHACQAVECRTDADCFDAKCNPASHTCAQCLTGADCQDPYQARCDAALGLCTSCKADADCAHLGLKHCDPITLICTDA